MKRFIIFFVLGCVANAAEIPKSYYVVPVPPEFSEVNSFEMEKGIFLKAEKEKTRLVYHLPPELVGENHEEINLLQTGPAGDWTQLDGKFGTAQCRFRQKKSGMCTIVYRALGNSAIAAETYLRREYADDPLLNKRIALAKFFAIDPAGIVRYGTAAPEPWN